MIYLDNAATAPVFPEVLEVMLPWFQPDHVGNASSIHSQGANAFRAIEVARKQVAQMINAEPSEIFFTSGGTESNNTALKMVNGFVLTDELEHHSVLECVENPRYAVKNGIDGYILGFQPARVRNNKYGRVDLEGLERLLRKNPAIGMVSIMWVNNELGTINPIMEIGTLCKKYKVRFHTDAVQAAGHIPIDVKKCNIDFLSMSGHKFGAPLGVGVLYIRSGVFKRPLIAGGSQEQGMRGGTYNVPGIVGIGKAAEIVKNRLPRQMEKWRTQEYVFLNALEKAMYGEYQVNAAEDRTHNIISLTIPNVNSESLLLLLDQKEIYVSTGSACSAASSESSHVLKGIGLSDKDAAATIRISLGYENTADEMEEAALAIAEVAHRLKAMYS